jgi:hypothetical protein
MRPLNIIAGFLLSIMSISVVSAQSASQSTTETIELEGEALIPDGNPTD